jgi:predicted transcriptional regulator
MVAKTLQSRRTSNAISLGNRKGFLKDILELFPEPKPHTNTVSTILKILMEKEFVGFKVHGRQHEYFPLISKETYSGKSMKSLVKNYFEGSYRNAVSFFNRKKRNECGRLRNAFERT